MLMLLALTLPTNSAAGRFVKLPPSPKKAEPETVADADNPETARTLVVSLRDKVLSVPSVFEPPSLKNNCLSDPATFANAKVLSRYDDNFVIVAFFNLLESSLSETKNSSAAASAVIAKALLGLTPRPSPVRERPDEPDNLIAKLPLSFSRPFPIFKEVGEIPVKPNPEPKKADAEISFDAERLFIKDEPVTFKD